MWCNLIFGFIWSGVFAGICWFEADEAKGPKYVWERVVFWIIFAVLVVLAGYCAFLFWAECFSLSKWLLVLLCVLSLLLFAAIVYVVRRLFHKI